MTISKQRFKLNKGWTKQRVMEQFKARNNGTRAVDHDGSCMYRADGNACAMGAFIPDNKYTEFMEQTVVSAKFIKQHGLSEFIPFTADGMRRMQRYHDLCDNPNFGDAPLQTEGDTYKAIATFLELEVE